MPLFSVTLCLKIGWRTYWHFDIGFGDSINGKVPQQIDPVMGIRSKGKSGSNKVQRLVKGETRHLVQHNGYMEVDDESSDSAASSKSSCAQVGSNGGVDSCSRAYGSGGYTSSTTSWTIVGTAVDIIAQEVADGVRMIDTCADEAERGITTKSTRISLYYEMTDEALKAYKGERNGNEYLINLIDSPGHIDFSAEANAALRITDGATKAASGTSMGEGAGVKDDPGGAGAAVVSVDGGIDCQVGHVHVGYE